MFDVDQNGYIDYQELLDGFKKLKIHVPNKHLKSVFSILDEDSNGKISLEEFKSFLSSAPAEKPTEPEGEEDEEEFYRRKEEEKRQREEERKKRSMVKDKEVEKYKENLEKDFKRDQESQNKDKTQQEIDQEKAQRKAEREKQREERSKSKDRQLQNIDREKQREERSKSKDRQPQKVDREKEREMRSKNKDAGGIIRDRQERAILEEVKEEKKRAYEEELINGELRVQVGKGYNLPNLLPESYKYFYLEFKLEGVNQDESFSSKPIEYYTKKSFQWSIKVPLLNCHPDDLGDEFIIRINASKNTFENCQFVGEIF